MTNGTAAKTAPKPKGEGVVSRFVKFVRESYRETIFKSAWPTWSELRQFTLVVIFAVLAVAIYIGVIDYVLSQLTSKLPGGT